MKLARNILAWCAPVVLALTLSAAAQETSSSDAPYTLKPGDTVSITVLEDSLLDREVLIAPDGRVSMPLAGSIVAAGLTPEQLQKVIQDRLRKNFVEPPNVTVSLTGLGDIAAALEDEELPREVYVLGEVGSPGRYEYDSETDITVLQALTLAGGIGPFAAVERIQVREVVDEIETIRLFNYDLVEEGQLNTARDLAALRDKAVIIVPERGLFE